jgi:hypothetical protein
MEQQTAGFGRNRRKTWPPRIDAVRGRVTTINEVTEIFPGIALLLTIKVHPAL